MNENRDLVMHISPKTIAWIFFWSILLVLAFTLRHLILVLLTAIVIATAIEPTTRWFLRHKVSRLPAVLLIYVLAALGIGLLFFFVVPPVVEQLGSINTIIPKSLQELNPFGYTASDISFLTNTFGGDNVSFQSVAKNISSRTLSDSIVGSIATVFGGVINLAIIIVVSFYLAVQNRGVENFLRVVTPAQQEGYVVDLWNRVEHKIGRWIQGQLLLGLIIGPVVYVGLSILGIKYALLLAILAAVFELIPFFGPVLSAVPAVLLGFNQSVNMGVVIILFYVIVQQLENHVVYPLVVKKMVGIPALVVVISLLAGSELVGFFGLVLAVPVSVLLMELLGDFEKHKQVRASNG